MTPDTPQSLARITQTEWEIAVIGAGPAGSIAAREAARKGRRTLLIDKAAFPRYKVCGCCLNGKALSALDSVGLGDLTARYGAVPLTRFELAAAGARARLPLPDGVALSRETLDHALIGEAQSEGAEFVPDARARLGPSSLEGWKIELNTPAGPATTFAKIVLAADGIAQGVIRTATGADSHTSPNSHLAAGAVLDPGGDAYGPGVIYMAVARGGYIGLVRLEDGRLNIAAALAPPLVRERNGLADACGAILDEAGLPRPANFDRAQWKGTPRITRRPLRVTASRLLAIGDAAGYVEPFTGEGMACAIALGREAATLACASIENFDQDTARRWERRHREVVGASQRRCRVIAAALRRPALVKAMTLALAGIPALGRPVVRSLNAGPAVQKDLHS